MSEQGSGYCIACGTRLESSHGYCSRCGAERWPLPAPGPSGPPQPGRIPAPPPGSAPALGALPWVYAAGSIFFLVWVSQALALFVSPAGRSQLGGELARQGIATPARPAALAAYGTVLIGAGLLAAVLHAAAFYGLRGGRRWGWLAAVVVAGLWSLVVVGIPVLVRLVDGRTRAAFGVD